jgi:parallel beta-helix repeat protein
MKKFALIILIFFQFLTPADAAVYYVDSINGNDSNNGLSSGNAWKSLKKVSSAVFGPGDKILLKRDGIWFEQLEIKGSGSNGNPIVISDYGTGRPPVIDGGLERKHCILLEKKNNVTVSNITMQNAAHASIRVKYGNGVTVENCSFFVTGHGGVFVENSTDCIISSNSITTPSGNFNKQTDGIYSQRNDNIIIDNNNIVISNEHPDQHCDGIQSYLDKNMIIRNNYVEQRNFKKSNAQGIYATMMTGMHTYYNNVVYCPNTRASVMGFRNLKTGKGFLKAYHNTLVGGASNILFVSENAGIDAKNNIFYSTGKTSVIRLETGEMYLDNNLYYHEGNGDVIGFGKGKKAKNVNAVKSEGREINGIEADPRFTSDFKLLPGSPCIDKGLFLGPPYDVDREGNKRSSGLNPDIGAYEFIQ